MTTTRLVVGIIATLVAVFAGGCGLLVVGAGCHRRADRLENVPQDAGCVMNERMSITFGLLATFIGLVGMAVIWIGAAPQSFVAFMVGFAVAVGGAHTAASGFKRRNGLVPSADETGGQNKEREKPRLTAMGLVFAVIGGLLMVFCGGCTLLIVLGETGSANFTSSAGAALVFGGFPFTIGLVIWLLAMTSRRHGEDLADGRKNGSGRS